MPEAYKVLGSISSIKTSWCNDINELESYIWTYVMQTFLQEESTYNAISFKSLRENIVIFLN